MKNVNQPFDDSKFNFNKVKPEEILFSLVNASNPSSADNNKIIINVSFTSYSRMTHQASSVSFRCLFSYQLWSRCGFGVFWVVNCITKHSFEQMTWRCNIWCFYTQSFGCKKFHSESSWTFLTFIFCIALCRVIYLLKFRQLCLCKS